MLIHKLQKLIKIADRYKDGWQVVEEYDSDELASNSDDKKKQTKAESKKRKERDITCRRMRNGNGPRAYSNDSGRSQYLALASLIKYPSLICCILSVL